MDLAGHFLPLVLLNHMHFSSTSIGTYPNNNLSTAQDPMETEAAVEDTHQKPYFMSETTDSPLKPLTLTSAKTEPANETEANSESTVSVVSQGVWG